MTVNTVMLRSSTQTAGIAADLLLRLRPNMCLWGAPPAYSGKGRPKVHGDKFKLADSSTGRAYCHIGAKTRSGDSSDSTRAGFHFRAEKGSSPAIAADYCFWKAFWETLP
jgi:hypothetical protein